MTWCMRKFASLFVLLLVLTGCSPEESAGVIRLSSLTEREGLIGNRIELSGVVSETKCPQILGVDLWGLEEYRGRAMKITGVLRQTVVAQSQFGGGDGSTGAPVDDRGPGTFYRLEDMHYELIGGGK